MSESDFHFYYQMVKNFIKDNYDHDVVLDNRSILKYGRNNNIGTSLVTIANMEVSRGVITFFIINLLIV